MSNRKAFQNLPGEENPQFLENGKKIYADLKKQYPNKTNEDLDNILNSLCAALVCLTYCNVSKDNHKQFSQLIYNIISKNLEN